MLEQRVQEPNSFPSLVSYHDRRYWITTACMQRKVGGNGVWPSETLKPKIKLSGIIYPKPPYNSCFFHKDIGALYVANLMGRETPTRLPFMLILIYTSLGWLKGQSLLWPIPERFYNMFMSYQLVIVPRLRKIHWPLPLWKSLINHEFNYLLDLTSSVTSHIITYMCDLTTLVPYIDLRWFPFLQLIG